MITRSVDEVRRQLLPPLSDVIDALGDEPDEVVLSFFESIRRDLEGVETEADLIDPFMQLVGTAPVVNAAGVNAEVLDLIDELLARAQALAQSM